MTEPHEPDRDAAGQQGPDSQPTRPLPQDSTGVMPTSYSHPSTSSDQEVAAGEPPTASTASDTSTAPAAGVPLTDEPAARGRKRTGLLVGSIAALAVLGAGGVLAYTALSGGGAQPAEVLPGDAYAYLRVDIDPSAGQKIAAVRFLDKIPQIKGFATGDPRKQLWELATKDADNDCVKKFSFDNDIAPWLGDRAGFALRPGGTADAPNAAFALQVTDEDAAKGTLTKLFACDDGEKPDLRMKGGYALITPPGKGDDLVAAVDKGTLAARATFKEDMAALGEEGVASFWGDLPALVKDVMNMAPEASSGAAVPADAKGRVVSALRFDPSYVELTGMVRGIQGASTVTPGKPTGSELATLPTDTMAAMHVSNGDQAIEAAWPQLKKQLDDLAAAQGQDDMVSMLEDQLGITLPDDLKALLGSSFTLALPAQDLGSDDPVLGAKVISKDAARAEEVLTTIEDQAGSSLLTKRLEGDHLYVATSPDYAEKLKAGGKLGDSEAFKAALGDVSTSHVAFFVDLDKLEKLYLDQVDGDARAALEAMRAVGMSASATSAGEGRFTLRVVGN